MIETFYQYELNMLFQLRYSVLCMVCCGIFKYNNVTYANEWIVAYIPPRRGTCIYIILVYLISDRKLVNIGLFNGCTLSLEVDTPVHDFGIYTHTIWGPSNYYYAKVIMNITCTFIVIHVVL